MQSAQITIYEPASVKLSQFGMERLLPGSAVNPSPRLGDFDDETMCFDVFHSASGDTILCLGPPLDFCRPAATNLSFSSVDHRVLAQRLEAPRIREQHTSRMTLRGQGIGDLDELILSSGGFGDSIAVRSSQAALLADRRVLMTVSKDNPLPWIRDWATFYVRLHGADAVLLYDNGSKEYAPQEIAIALADIPGLQRIVIVSWPFRYDGNGPHGQPSVDNFCQTGALDHARRCFCPYARSVLNVDIDELLPDDGMSIFEQVETSSFAVLLFRGVWAEAPGIHDREALQRVRHRDSTFVWRSQMQTLGLGNVENLCRTKWVAVPSRCHPDVEWGIHDIYPATQRAYITQQSWRSLDRFIVYRHCRQINMGWKTDRWRSSADFAVVCAPDRAMMTAYSRAFPVDIKR